MRIVFDEDLCEACGCCEAACALEHNIDLFTGDRPYRKVNVIRENGVERHLSLSCHHCERPKCARSCVFGCIKKDKNTGFVIYTHRGCTGCGRCEQACENSAIQMRLINSSYKIEKCDGCIEYIKKGEVPPCVAVCPCEALRLIDDEERHGYENDWRDHIYKLKKYRLKKK